MDKNKGTQENISDLLTKSLGDIMEQAVKDVNSQDGEEDKQQNTQKKKETDSDGDVQKSKKTESDDDTKKDDGNNEKTVEALNKIVDTLGNLDKRLQKIEDPKIEEKQAKSEIAKQVASLIKEQGYNPEDYDFNFEISEKKKGSTSDEDEQDDFKKKNSGNSEEDNYEDDFEKAYEEADEEGKKQLSNAYWKKLLMPDK